MILTCPSCDTRYQADAAKFPAAGRQVRCAKCGHVWHQPGPAGEAEPEPVIAPPEPVVAQEEPASVLADKGTRGFAPRPAPVEDAPPRAWMPALGVVAGWIGLIAVVLLIGWSAVRYRQEIAVVWPQSAGVYSTLGMNVNAHGIDFAHVDYHRESQDGQIVLVVTGSIINKGSRELPVPQTVRVTLSDANNHELYHWPFTPAAQTLKPGQSVAFRTQLSSPPAGARHLELRFTADAK